MVECTGLENRRTERYRGFESLSLRNVVTLSSDLLFSLRAPQSQTPYGEMAEWSNAPVLKTGVLRGTGGSNPSLSAKVSVTSCKTTSCADFSFKGAPNLRQNFSVSRTFTSLGPVRGFMRRKRYYIHKSATKPFNVLLACTRSLITELSDK